MNRQFKFRVWDIRLRKFNYFDLHTAYGNIPSDSIQNIQQFTGLYDVNNKEIFEGDIVLTDRKDSFSSWNKGKIIYADHVGSFYVCYFKPAPMELPEIAYDQLNQWEMEIIGNIFEPPPSKLSKLWKAVDDAGLYEKTLNEKAWREH